MERNTHTPCGDKQLIQLWSSDAAEVFDGLILKIGSFQMSLGTDLE